MRHCVTKFRELGGHVLQVAKVYEIRWLAAVFFIQVYDTCLESLR